nr:MAG TPA_asm: hypothetical protein [Microviridae sp.]
MLGYQQVINTHKPNTWRLAYSWQHDHPRVLSRVAS